MMRKKIGIPVPVEQDEYKLSLDYVEYLRGGGFVPILLPLFGEEEDSLNELAGFLFPGGDGVTLNLLTLLPEDLIAADSKRVFSDLQYIKYALARNLPIFGICYGMQLVACHLGGSIYGDITRDGIATKPHSPKRGGKSHEVNTVSGSFMEASLGERVTVNSNHIQSITALPSIVSVSSSDLNGIIESVESAQLKFLGVQFHPEKMFSHGESSMLRLLNWFRA
jgi:putative glutamine amidotransferase